MSLKFLILPLNPNDYTLLTNAKNGICLFFCRKLVLSHKPLLKLYSV